MAQRIGFVAVTICTLLLGACNGSSKPQSRNPQGSSSANSSNASGEVESKPAKLTRGGFEPAEDDTLLLFYGDDPDTLNIITASDSVSDAMHRRTYDYLARRKYGDPLNWEPQLAESWEFDEENLEFTIHLRKGVMWHPMTLPNGEEIPAKEFTSRDVKFTFDCLMNEHVDAADKRSYYLDPDEEDPEKKVKIKLTVIDKYNVKIKWTKPYFLADEYTLMIQMCPRHIYSVDENGEPISFDFSSKEFADGFNSHWANMKICGTGPMILKEYEKSNRIVFERNPGYWGDPYYFSKIVYRYITNLNTSTQQLLTNDLDYGSIPQIDQYLSAKDHENVVSGNVELMEFPRTAYRFMGYNLHRKIFEDKNVRMAISHAVPTKDIIEQIYHGLAMRQTGPFLPRGPFSAKDVEPVPLDLDAARKLLDEAGWKDSNENGTRDKEIDGELVEFKYDVLIFADSPQYLSIAELIKDNLRQIGIEMQISPTKWALFLEKMDSKEFDSMILGWVSDFKSDPFQLWHSSQADLENSSNLGYKNEEVDKLIEELRVTMDDDKQVKLYHQIHRLIAADQPYTFLYSELGTGARHSRIENVKFYPALRPHSDAREWKTKSPRRLGK
ncbi:MAG: hypothetical protein CMJ64_26625 [Planctomycetaceae bacterium]|nr:hypothetical protein [Planctomycetaceae bacterium]